MKLLKSAVCLALLTSAAYAEGIPQVKVDYDAVKLVTTSAGRVTRAAFYKQIGNSLKEVQKLPSPVVKDANVNLNGLLSWEWKSHGDHADAFVISENEGKYHLECEEDNSCSAHHRDLDGAHVHTPDRNTFEYFKNGYKAAINEMTDILSANGNKLTSLRGVKSWVVLEDDGHDHGDHDGHNHKAVAEDDGHDHEHSASVWTRFSTRNGTEVFECHLEGEGARKFSCHAKKDGDFDHEPQFGGDDHGHEH